VKTIVWDVDDVLNDLMKSWLEKHWLPKHRQCRFKYAEISENPPHNLINATLDEYRQSLDSFRNSETARRMRPSKKVLNWFAENGCKYRHIALTSRSIVTVPVLAEWVFTHFGHWIKTFSFVPAARKGQKLPVYDTNKGDYLAWLGKGDVFIDDDENNVKLAAKQGIRTILFPRPWNSSKSTVAQALKQIK
jgi:hypothetical protein